MTKRERIEALEDQTRLLRVQGNELTGTVAAMDERLAALDRENRRLLGIIGTLQGNFGALQEYAIESRRTADDQLHQIMFQVGELVKLLPLRVVPNASAN